MTTASTMRLLQQAASKIDELGDRIAAAEVRERREQSEAQARADHATYLTSREHLIDVQAAKREHQARADDCLQAWGERAPPPIATESINAYRLRLARIAQKRLPEGDELRGISLDELPAAAFANFEPDIFSRAKAAASRNDSAAPGELREVERIDPKTGFKERVFFGECFTRLFAPPVRRVLGFWTEQGFRNTGGRYLHHR
jgi:hypothetical protein